MSTGISKVGEWDAERITLIYILEDLNLDLNELQRTRTSRGSDTRRGPFIYPYTVRGYFLNLLESISPWYAKNLHDHGKRLKPYAIQIYSRDIKLKLNFNIFNRVITKRLYNYLINLVDNQANFGKYLYKLIKVKRESICFRDLAINSQRISGFKIHFTSPTYFNLQGHDFKARLPVPSNLIRNLATLWNEFTYEHIKVNLEPLIEWVKYQVEIESYRLKTQKTRLGKNRFEIGFKGWVKYNILDKDSAYCNWLDCLLKFGQYTNVGGNRTMGMGRIKYQPLVSV
ncbi:MAG: CRISPR system precrRNA processing endoribonuclease RAMP protein Cas6 [Promethearchaeota archaeon]